MKLTLTVATLAFICLATLLGSSHIRRERAPKALSVDLPRASADDTVEESETTGSVINISSANYVEAARTSPDNEPGKAEWDSPGYWVRPAREATDPPTLEGALPCLIYGLRTGCTNSKNEYVELCRRHLDGLASNLSRKIERSGLHPHGTIVQLTNDFRSDLYELLPRYVEATLKFRAEIVALGAYTIVRPGDSPLPPKKVSIYATATAGFSAQFHWDSGFEATYDQVDRQINELYQSYKRLGTELAESGR